MFVAVFVVVEDVDSGSMSLAESTLGLVDEDSQIAHVPSCGTPGEVNCHQHDPETKHRTGLYIRV